MKEHYSISEVAKIAGVGYARIFQRITNGEIKVTIGDTGKKRISSDEVLKHWGHLGDNVITPVSESVEFITALAGNWAKDLRANTNLTKKAIEDKVLSVTPVPYVGQIRALLKVVL